MIVVKVELHSAITGKVELLGQAIIRNVITSPDGKRANYKIHVGRRGERDLKKVYDKPQRQGWVSNWPRESYSVWRLVSRTLRNAFPEEQ